MTGETVAGEQFEEFYVDENRSRRSVQQERQWTYPVYKSTQRSRGFLPLRPGNPPVHELILEVFYEKVESME